MSNDEFRAKVRFDGRSWLWVVEWRSTHPASPKWKQLWKDVDGMHATFQSDWNTSRRVKGQARTERTARRRAARELKGARRQFNSETNWETIQ